MQMNLITLYLIKIGNGTKKAMENIFSPDN